MPITFNEIPSTTLVPHVWMEFDPTQARPGTGIQPYKALLVGARVAAGTVPELEPTIVRSAEEAGLFFGRGSQLHGMAQAYFASNLETELTMIAVDDVGAGTSATFTVTVTGTATAAGSIFLYVVGRRLVIPVQIGDTATVVGDAIEAAITALTELPFAAANVTGTVTLTCKNRGTIGNQLDVRTNHLPGETTPAGLTVVAAAAVAGATDPDLSEAWPFLGDTHYNVIGVAWTDSGNLGELATELESRAAPNRSIDAVGICAIQDTLANLTTLGDGRNDRRLSIMGYESGLSAPYEWSAAITARVAKSAAQDPALPFQTLRLDFIVPPTTTDLFTLLERETLLANGIATFDVTAGGNATIGRLVTTYEANDVGAPDDAFRDINVALTLGFLRWSLRTELSTKFAQFKLADDGRTIPAGQKIVTPQAMKAQIVAIANEWVERGIIEDIETFKASLIVERNVALDPNRLDVKIQPDLVNQLRVTRVQAAFIV